MAKRSQASAALAWIDTLEQRLRPLGGEERAEKEKAYLKSDRIHLGVPVPAIRKVARGWAKEHGLDRDGLLALVPALWRSNTHELMMAAADLLDHRSKLLLADDLPMLEGLLRGAKTWALVDGLAVHVVGPLLLRQLAALRMGGAIGADTALVVGIAETVVDAVVRVGAPLVVGAIGANAIVGELQTVVETDVVVVATLADAGRLIGHIAGRKVDDGRQRAQIDTRHHAQRASRPAAALNRTSAAACRTARAGSAAAAAARAALSRASLPRTAANAAATLAAPVARAVVGAGLHPFAAPGAGAAIDVARCAGL